MNSFDLDFRPTYFGPQSSQTVYESRYGGEYLPNFNNVEIEIGKVILESSTNDVISIRVTKVDDSYSYRVVDEYGSTFEIPESLQITLRPLKLKEMISLINNTVSKFEDVEESGEPGLVKGFITYMLGEGDDPSVVMTFVRVESGFYPELEEFFEYQKGLWINEYKD